MLAEIGVIQTSLMIVVCVVMVGIVLVGGNWVGTKIGMSPTLMKAMEIAVIALVGVTLLFFVLNQAGCDWREWDLPVHRMEKSGK